MDFQTCVSTRRSVRKYQATPVADSVLHKVIETAALAPSWKNTQTTRYLVVRDPALRAQIAQEGVAMFPPNQKIIESAPAVVLVTTITGRSGFERDGSFSTSKGTHWESFDAGIATQTLCLAATNEGLATVVMGIYDEAAVAKAAGIPEGQKLSAIVALGYADEEPPMPKRKTVEDLLTTK